MPSPRHFFFSLAICIAALTELFVQSAAHADIVTDLVGHWEFSADGPSQPDSSANSNAGLQVGATWVNDAIRGGVMSFDGDNDYVNVADSASLSITGNITIAAWVNVQNYDSSRGLVSKSDDNQPAPYDYYLYEGSTPRGKPAYLRGNGTTGGSTVGTSAIPLNEWAHVAVTMNGTTVTHYLNGVANGTGTQTAAIADSNNSLRIGNRDDLATDMLGLMDDVRIYDRALTSDDVSELFNVTAIPEPTSFAMFGIAMLGMSRRRRVK